jgi:hypothetical protein
MGLFLNLYVKGEDFYHKADDECGFDRKILVLIPIFIQK